MSNLETLQESKKELIANVQAIVDEATSTTWVKVALELNEMLYVVQKSVLLGAKPDYNQCVDIVDMLREISDMLADAVDIPSATNTDTTTAGVRHPLPIGYLGRLIPVERYDGEMVMDVIDTSTDSTMVINYNNVGKRVNSRLSTIKPTLQDIDTDKGRFVCKVVSRTGEQVNFKPIWLNSEGVMTLSSVTMSADLLETFVTAVI